VLTEAPSAVDIFIRRPPPFAVSERIAQVHDEGVEIVADTAGGRLVAAMLGARPDLLDRTDQPGRR
jgi:hypothetical protein